MASDVAVIDYCSTKKMFSWTFNDFNKLKIHHLEGEQQDTKFLKTSQIEAIDSDGRKYFATGCLKILTNRIVGPRIGAFEVEISPFPGMVRGFYQINNDENHLIKPKNYLTQNYFSFEIPYEISQLKIIQKISFYIDVSAFRTKTFKISSFQQSNKLELYKELKEMWKNDPKNEFTIKCENQEFKVLKPIMASRSPVFKKTFETEMKEKSQNFVEIKEFQPKIIEKMIEFCETDAIKDFEGIEDKLFKISHLYQIQQLMYFSIEKMAKNIKNENVAEFIEIANLYELNEFKEFCMQFAQRNNIVF